ncbi:MAG: GGDEF domain-containing protein [Deltaproteobacteria bacterium]|nr:GGDEF domain-containing protein [Deltaproteobacteria bacterium]MDX9761787.1 diguanylate cyclase [Desulfomonilia bacterium]HPW68192.1 diguanylate cyclase [Deltaproteobacteria bacterium]
MISAVPCNDQNQALRVHRFLMALASYAMWMLLTFYCYYQGWFRMSLGETLTVFAAIIVMNLCLYLLFMTGLNKRFKDPSLTMLQMILATFWTMVVAYYTDEVRGFVLLLYLVVFIFGVFRLQLRQFFILAIYALTGYGYVIVLLFANHPEKINLQAEILYWVVLAAVLSWFAAIGSYINHIRKKLAKANIELSQANERIRRSAIHDELTGVFNRRQMMNIIRREKSLADRGEPSFSLCIFDLDDFKRVNDTYGHIAGDMVLRTLVQAIKNNVREQDYIARYGGEEFVVILAYPDIDEAIACAERIKTLTSSLNFPGLPDDFRITISMGVTRYLPGESIDALISRADAALYRAKSSGKNKIVVEEPPHRKTGVHRIS